MLGFVYIISNPAMPGLVKVGFSTKDPRERALELSGTWVPEDYRVEYCCLVDNPELLERETHESLASCAAGREWFRCSGRDAVRAIRNVAQTRLLKELEFRHSSPEGFPGGMASTSTSGDRAHLFKCPACGKSDTFSGPDVGTVICPHCRQNVPCDVAYGHKTIPSKGQGGPTWT